MKKGNGKERLYIAYGSNLNLGQMAVRCPGASVAGTSEVKGYGLLFRGVATIEPKAGANVPALLWRITPQDERNLDRYEGWPHLYRKETFRVELAGKSVSAMAYVMNDGRKAAMPSRYYYDVIEEGYRTAGMDRDALKQALEWTREVMGQEAQSLGQPQGQEPFGGFRM